MKELGRDLGPETDIYDLFPKSNYSDYVYEYFYGEKEKSQSGGLY